MLNFFGPAPHRLAEATAQHINHRLRERHAAGFKIQYIGGLDAARDEEHRHVPDDLAARRDLHDVTEKLVHFCVCARDLRPAMCQAHRRRLLFQICELPTRHLVQINFRAARFGRRIKRRVVSAHLFPVIGELIERIQIKTRIALGELQCRDNRVQIRLTRRTGHRSIREVNNVHARFRRRQNGRRRNPARVVRVEVDWNSHFVLERLDQQVRRRRATQSRHVFDRENVRAHAFQFLRELHVVTQRVFVARLVEDVARVADRRFADTVRFVHGFHRHFKVR